MASQVMRFLLLPLILAVGLSACDSGAVNPGYVNTASASGNTATPVGTGRVVAINDVSLRGSGGGGSGRGPLIGGLLGGLGGAAIGASTSRSLGGGIVGGLLGAVGGAIAGTIFESHGNPMTNGRGIEVTVERDDGRKVTVAQRDDGDIQLGDRVQIVEDRGGVARVVRDNSRTVDRTASNGPPPSQYPQDNGPPPSQQYPQDNGPPSQQYQPQDYGQGQSQSRYGSPQPQNDPRYGNLN